MSTEDFQDRASSYRWQREVALDLIADRGTIVAEFFDVGHSRRKAWDGRPQAAALLEAVADPDRGFDAIVVGEYERAFHGTQLLDLAPRFERHGVQLWLPETDGPVNHHSPTHQALIMMLGARSKREVQRSRFRVMAAMQAQACEQGRYASADLSGTASAWPDPLKQRGLYQPRGGSGEPDLLGWHR
jgi:DNA invertase Pin-like site-specific DNA recombinase